MTEKKLLRVLKGEAVTSPPIWLMRQAGRYLPEYRKIRAEAGSFLDLCYAPKLAAEVTMQPIHRYGFDAAILFSDILVVPHGLGQDVWFVENEGPKLAAIQTAEALGSLDPNKLIDRLAPVYETVGILASTLPRETTLIGFAGAPWTVASYMVEGGSSRDFATAKSWAYRDPEGFGTLMNILVDATARHLCAQIRHGAEVVQIFDSWAGVFSETAFQRWIIEPNKALVARIREQFPNVPIIGFPRGAGIMYSEYVAQTGVTAVSLDTTVPTGWAAKNLQTKMPVQGNLDPLALLVGGDALEIGVRGVMEGLSGGPFIFNLGHGIVKETPPDHVETLVSLVRGGSV
ncbi:MAG: uroporphyrinogen decarboxylase [Alphaproteobacteria bacterium]|nr:uroporphyrinogen decarboxylase [Alphaproteobacteria bacterium]